MKRRSALFALALLAFVGAALWGVDYRLDHPPMTQADKEFRALVAGANSVEITQGALLYKPRARVTSRKMLNAVQTREFIQHLRFVNMDENTSMAMSPLRKHNIRFTFFHQKHNLIQVSLEHEEGRSFICAYSNYNPSDKNLPLNYQLNPRFEKPLRRALDAYLPQRIRP